MFSNKEEKTPEPPMPEITDQTPIMTETVPVGGGAETPQEMTTDIPQVPDMNLTPDIPSMDTSVPTPDTLVAEPTNGVTEGADMNPVFTQEQANPDVGEMPVNAVTETNPSVIESDVHNPITESENGETSSLVEKANELVQGEIKSIDNILTGYEDLQNEFEELKQTVDNNNNEKPNLLNRRARLQEIKEGIESGDPKVIAMAETLLSLPKLTQTSSVESTSVQNSDTQAA